ncbi:MAG: RNA methyltransferase, partial [Bacteroidota bacterium]|nr:RNA methyltransferase [Bacteroidota bacterium]
EKWNDFDEPLFNSIMQEEEEGEEKPFNFHIYGSDISPLAIKIAEKNIQSASLSKYIQLEVKPIQKITQAPENGLLVTNPPYGERITSADLTGLYEQIGERLKHAFPGYTAWILSYREDCFDKIGLHPTKKIKLMNGPLDCEFREYEIFSGKRKSFVQQTHKDQH